MKPTNLCPALMIAGPPDSGKSVFSHALFQALLTDNPDIYLQRAHWDGEGNYLLELGAEETDKEIEAFKARDRGNLIPVGAIILNWSVRAASRREAT